ncbi:MAG: F0F1-type synthase subunit b, F-type H+-transporting ATPase subunit b [Candidatus Parcubacteria bacterium]|jgi:F-type H+-transporting ATPase subunit b
MEILHTFGIDWVLLVAQFINFGIILFVLKKFLYKPVMSMLQARREEIQKGIHDAEKAQRLLEEASEKETAQNESRKMLEDTKKQADAILSKTKEETRKETERMILDAKKQIEYETKQAEKRLAGNISELAIAMLAKSLPDLVSEDEKTNVLKLATKKLKGRID